MNANDQLTTAITENNVPAIKQSLEAGASVHAKSVDGFSLLEVAQKAGSLHAARFLLDQGVAPNVQTATHETLLHRAARQGDHGFVYLLLEHGADPEAIDTRKRRAVDVVRPKGGYVHQLLESKSKVKQPTLF